MSDIKPNVFQKRELSQQDQIEEANKLTEKLNNEIIEAERNRKANHQPSEKEQAAAAEMKRRTEEQLKKREEQRLKNLQLVEDAKKEGKTIPKEAFSREKDNNSSIPYVPYNGTNNINNNQPPINNDNNYHNNDNGGNDKRKQEIEKLSIPDFNTPYDKLPLPSEGKCYKNHRKSSIDVSYVTTLDESILTSPNLLNSGEFLEVLVNRKLLSYDLRYNDLLKGDRNAIMLWLRATTYGEMYPIVVLDEEGNPFETEINLNDLKTIKLGAEPDNEGLFDYILKQINVPIKFKLLNVGEIDNIAIKTENEIKNGSLVNNLDLYELQESVVEVNGVRDREQINKFISTLRPLISKDLRKYIESIESGVDLEITVRTPRGGSVSTFLPLNKKFFWPDL